jgi:hypothetical protein
MDSFYSHAKLQRNMFLLDEDINMGGFNLFLFLFCVL